MPTFALSSILARLTAGLRAARRPRHAPMPIIVGSPRSGTTLLRLMLDAHPQLAIPPETGFLTLTPPATVEDRRRWFFDSVTGFPPDAPGWRDFGVDAADFARRLAGIEPFDLADGFRLFYRMYAERFGKRRSGEKTPLYGLHMPYLATLLPEARFIHIIRDGRAAAASLRKMWFSPGETLDVQARYWRNNVTTIRRHGAQSRHYVEVRYENLLVDTERELRRLCDYLELSFDPAMLNHHVRAPSRLAEHRGRQRADGSVIVSDEQRRAQQAHTTRPPDGSRIDAWRSLLTADEIAAFEAVAGELLRELGYQPSAGDLPATGASSVRASHA